MSKWMRVFVWVVLLGGLASVVVVVLAGVLVPTEPFTVGPHDPPPGVGGEWSPDVLGLLVSADLADGYTFPNAAGRSNGWRLIGPAALQLEDGGQYAVPVDTPLWGGCSILDGDSGLSRPRHCVVHIGLEGDGATIAWIKVIDESRSAADGMPVVPDSVVTLINFDHVDEGAGLLFGRGGDMYRLAVGWEWSGRARPSSGHPVFTTFDFNTGLVTRLEPAAFEG